MELLISLAQFLLGVLSSVLATVFAELALTKLRKWLSRKG